MFTKQQVQDVIQSWRSANLEVRSGATVEQVRETERRLGVNLPGDFATFYQAVEGMEEAVYDRHFIRFWQLAEIVPAAGQLENTDAIAYAGYFVFADWSISAHEYAVHSGNAAIALTGGPAPKVIASSFSEFIYLYLNDPDALFGRE